MLRFQHVSKCMFSFSLIPIHLFCLGYDDIDTKFPYYLTVTNLCRKTCRVYKVGQVFFHTHEAEIESLTTRLRSFTT